MYICHTVAHLTELGEHDNGPALSVVNHLPEISGRGVHGTLGYDECFLLLVALGAEKRERREKKEKKRKTNLLIAGKKAAKLPIPISHGLNPISDFVPQSERS